MLGTLAAGCSKKVEQVEDIRPVRVMVVAPANAQSVLELAGDIQPRYESKLGFRVGGKVVVRHVDVGSTVRRGQVLMQLDPKDFQLAQAQANASVSAAGSNLALAKAELDRYRELRQKNFVSQALLDAKDAAYKSAAASHEQATAGLKVQANQSSYTTLVADVDGVVTALDAEIGQVVAPGVPVVRIAQMGEKEVRISIPEDQLDSLRRVPDLKVRTWANQGQQLEGHLRELSPMADPATRTYTAKISIPKAGPDVRLGMTATVSFTSQSAQAAIHLPLTALFNDKNQTSVWVVENGAVKLVPVQVAGAIGNDLMIAAGLNAGQSVVTAGINLLRPGQKVSILGQEPAVKLAAEAKQ
jgi:RND family efflux transporter MFP subunit